MSVTVKIQNQVIEFPTSGESPNWAPAMTQFALAVENALNATIGPYDVAPQIQTIDANGIVDQDVTNLSFPPVDVSQVVIDYSIQRSITNVTNTIYTEGGVLTCTYRPENNKWSWSQIKSGDARASFNVENSGQVQCSFESLPGDANTHTGILSFRATALVSHD